MDLNLGMNELAGFGKTISDIGSEMITKARENAEAVDLVNRMNSFAEKNLGAKTQLIDSRKGPAARSVRRSRRESGS